MSNIPNTVLFYFKGKQLFYYLMCHPLSSL